MRNYENRSLLILTGKNCQRIPSGTLNMFLRLWMITELAQIKIFAQRVLQPGGTAIIFSQKWLKSKFDTTLSIKKPFVTLKFCDQNFYRMHHFEDMNILSPLEPLYSSSSL